MAESKGLPCIRLLLTHPPATNPINGSAFCLAPGKREFNASGGPSFPGSVWVLAAPPGINAAELDWLDRGGNPAGASLDASPHFNQR